MRRRKICVVTTSRADFGLLTGLLKSIQSDRALELQVIASGMHLSRAFGRTWREIKAAGLHVDRRVDMELKGCSAMANLNSVGVGVIRFAKALGGLKPDILVLLGDRFELMSAAVSALMLRIPIAHIHGGERSEGALDDSVRHALTKMAVLHFTATEEYRRRVVQMGESPNRVFNFGAPGLDRVHQSRLLTRQELQDDLGISFQGRVALVTYHPATLDKGSVDEQVGHLLAAIKATRLKALFTLANADAGGSRINVLLRRECALDPSRFTWVPHLGHLRYLSCLRHCALMIGNSSSGLTEAPSFRLPVVNIGDRQRGRIRAPNVVDVPCSCAGILRGIRRACSRSFATKLRTMRNPYDRYRDGRASDRIKAVLKRVPLTTGLMKKEFYDWTGPLSQAAPSAKDRSRRSRPV